METSQTVAIITGATTGIGRATGRRGSRIGLIALGPDKLPFDYGLPVTRLFAPWSLNAMG